MGGFGCIREGELNQGECEDIMVEVGYGRDVGITWEISIGKVGEIVGEISYGRT